MRALIVHPTRRATLLTTGLLLFSLILAGCGGGSSSAVPTATATATATATPTATPTNTPTPSGSQASVRMSGSIASGFAFTPATITIKVGTAVVWINATSAPHTSTSDVGSPFAWDTSFIQPGQASTPVTFTQVGTFHYHCNVHPYMHGTIVVTS